MLLCIIWYSRNNLILLAIMELETAAWNVAFPHVCIMQWNVYWTIKSEKVDSMADDEVCFWLNVQSLVFLFMRETDLMTANKDATLNISFGNVDQKSVGIESICMNKVQGMWRQSGSWSGSNTGPAFWSDVGVAMDTLVYRRVLLSWASQDELPPIHSERNRNNDAFKLPKRGNVGHQITTAVLFFH